jgi:hypothetical protein
MAYRALTGRFADPLTDDPNAGLPPSPSRRLTRRPGRPEVDDTGIISC